jgi:hypothetical protein
MHEADDPRCYIGDVVEAAETDDGLATKGRFDLDTEFGKSAYRNTKGRKVSGLSIGYARQLHQDRRRKRADRTGVDRGLLRRLGANERALVRRCSAGVRADQGRVVPPGSRAGNHEHDVHPAVCCRNLPSNPGSLTCLFVGTRGALTSRPTTRQGS